MDAASLPTSGPAPGDGALGRHARSPGVERTFEGTRSVEGMEGAATASPASLLGPAAVTVGASPTDFAGDADAELMASVAAGDAAAFEMLVERHQRPIVGYLRGMLGDREEALDGAQEVFVRVLTRADRYS